MKVFTIMQLVYFDLSYTSFSEFGVLVDVAYRLYNFSNALFLSYLAIEENMFCMTLYLPQLLILRILFFQVH